LSELQTIANAWMQADYAIFGRAMDRFAGARMRIGH
jgi:hypothetical protein